MNANVLIVDDSLTVRMDLTETFEAAGYRVSPCASARDLREALKREIPALIVLDVVLPDGDGVDLLRELREAPATRDVPILMLSTEAEVGDRVRGLKHGADDYVGKPYESGYVLSRARSLMRAQNVPTPDGDKTLLVVDDSPTFRAALCDALREAGYRTIEAASGEEGLVVAAGARPVAIVVDGVMEGIDGATFIRRLRLDTALRSTPCIMLTGSKAEDAERDALEAGADAFVTKSADFSVVLARLQALLRGKTAAPQHVVSNLGDAKRILVIDDSPTQLYSVANMLRGEGYDVVLAHSGIEALELLSVQTADCILLDLVMPGLSGLHTCKRIKAEPRTRDIPLLIYTSIDDRAHMIDSLSMGADDYITKSNDHGVLKARVRAQIRRRQFEDENRQAHEKRLAAEVEAIEAAKNRELAEMRAAMVAELERKNRELEAFSYTVSHDLRAPLRRIDGFSRALAEEYGPKLDDRARDYLKRVSNSATRMAQLIEELLNLGRMSRAELRRGRVDISALCESVADELSRGGPSHHVDVLIQPGMGAHADGALVRVVFENLIGNAFKFTGKTVKPKIEIGTRTEQGETVFFVKDNGAGFDPTYADKLFRPFQRLHEEKDFPGTGVGLATIQRIIDRHGGRVWAEGKPGQGATISFTLPEKRLGAL